MDDTAVKRPMSWIRWVRIVWSRYSPNKKKTRSRPHAYEKSPTQTSSSRIFSTMPLTSPSPIPTTLPNANVPLTRRSSKPSSIKKSPFTQFSNSSPPHRPSQRPVNFTTTLLWASFCWMTTSTEYCPVDRISSGMSRLWSADIPLAQWSKSEVKKAICLKNVSNYLYFCYPKLSIYSMRPVDLWNKKISRKFFQFFFIPFLFNDSLPQAGNLSFTPNTLEHLSLRLNILTLSFQYSLLPKSSTDTRIFCIIEFSISLPLSIMIIPTIEGSIFPSKLPITVL